MKKGDWALGLGLNRKPIPALEAMALAFEASLSQSRPLGQGTQMGRGLQTVRAAPGPQEAAGRRGRHDLEGEWSGAHGVQRSLGERGRSD